MKTLQLDTIQDRARTHRGVNHPGRVNKGHQAEIVVGQSIRLFGIKDVAPKYKKKSDGMYEPETSRCMLHPECLVYEAMAIECLAAHPENKNKELYETTFKIGDTAEYDSYNLSYTGTITAISEKTVTIVEDHGTRAHRLSIYEFDRRNYDFDLEKITNRNNEMMMTL